MIPPGPGRSADAGVYEELLRECKGEFQSRRMSWSPSHRRSISGTASMQNVMHGKQSVAKQVHPLQNPKSVPEQFEVACYHSFGNY